MKSLFKFHSRRWWAFGVILAALYLVLFLGAWVGIFIPLVGGYLFLAGLMLWYLPGILFNWTGLFRYHEFGAEPTGVAGYVVMLLFYAAIAFVLSWPFVRRKAE
jgi:hypothetical protein